MPVVSTLLAGLAAVGATGLRTLGTVASSPEGMRWTSALTTAGLRRRGIAQHVMMELAEPGWSAQDQWGVVRLVDNRVPGERVVDNVLRSMQKNDFPDTDSGVRCLWDWTHDLYRGDPVNGHGNFTRFLQRSRVSEIGMLMDCEGWTLEAFSPIGDGSRYASQVAVVSPRGDLDARNSRRFLFQLRRELRPPYDGAWSIWAIVVSAADGSLRDHGGRGGL